MLSEALVTFTAAWVLTRHVKPQTMRRAMGHKGKIDVAMHIGVVALFHGTFSGLMQAEASAIMMSCYMLGYRKLYGYEIKEHGVWVRYPGKLTEQMLVGATA